MKEKAEFTLPSRIETIDEVATIAARLGAENGVDEAGLFGIDLAVREAVANAVKHGNKFNETKRVKIAFERADGEFIIEIEDEGSGFDWDHVPDPTNPENLLKASGRGILFMRNFMDNVSWRRSAKGGTIVRLAKKF